MVAFGELDVHIFDLQAPSDPTEMKELEKNDAKAKVAIGIPRSGEHLEHCRGTDSAFDMWTEVMKLIQRRTLLKRLTARHPLDSARMSDKERFLAYLTRMTQLAVT